MGQLRPSHLDIDNMSCSFTANYPAI